MTALIRTSAVLVLLSAAVAGGSVSPSRTRAFEEGVLPDRHCAVAARVPAYIEVNRGQAPADVGYVARSTGYVACIAPSAVAFRAGGNGPVVTMRLLAARPGARGRAARPLDGRSHYLLGSERGRWIRDVPHVADVLVERVYPGIDMRWRRGPSGGRIAYQFELAPGADPDDISMEFDGADRVGVASDGDLLVTTRAGEFRHSRPIVYEVVDGARRRIPGAFRVRGRAVVGFRIGARDPSARLVIDPEISYSTYFGGSDHDVPTDIAVDADGAAIMVGRGFSTNLPTTSSAVQTDHGGGYRDGFVAMLNAAGSDLLYSSFVGGSGQELDPSAFVFDGSVALDASGVAYFTGRTSSTDFPTANAAQSSSGGAIDAFIVKIPPPLPPSGPTDLAVTPLSDRRVRLEWVDGSTTESGFEVQRAAAAGSLATVTTVAADIESFEDAGLAGSTTYRWRVRSTNEFGASEWSDVAAATTPPPPPSSVSAASPNNRAVTLTWSDDAADETGYLVERALGYPGVGFSVLATLPPDSTSYTDRSVQPETKYTYRVRTMGSDANSTPSLEVCITTGPANPTSLLAITESDSGILLRWSDNSAIESGYQIERTASGGAPEIVMSVPRNTSEHADDTVAAETEYTYRVRAFADAGMSPWSPTATTRTAPAAPSDPFGVAISSSRLHLTWTDNSAVENGFEVRRRIHGTEMPHELVKRLPRNTMSFVDEGLLQETTYDYTVNAYDTAGDSNSIEISELETTAVLVIRKLKLRAAKKKKPAKMSIQAEIDFGGYRPEAAIGAAIGVNGTVLAVNAVRAKKKGRVLSGEGDGVAFTLKRKSPTASRGSLTITVTGEPAEIDGEAELTIAFTTGPFTAAGSIEPRSGRFDLKKRIGRRIDPDVVPTKLKLALGGLESDALQFAASFEPRAVPGEIPNALVTVGDARLILPAAAAATSGGKVTYRLSELPQATLVVDYDKGELRLEAKKLELGDYEKGAVPTLLDVIVGDLRWRDVPVLRSNGKRVSY